MNAESAFTQVSPDCIQWVQSICNRSLQTPDVQLDVLLLSAPALPLQTWGGNRNERFCFWSLLCSCHPPVTWCLWRLCCCSYVRQQEYKKAFFVCSERVSHQPGFTEGVKMHSLGSTLSLVLLLTLFSALRGKITAECQNKQSLHPSAEHKGMTSDV